MPVGIFDAGHGRFEREVENEKQRNNDADESKIDRPGETDK